MTLNIFATIRARVVAAVATLHPGLAADVLARIQVEPPRDPAHGDMATNAALVCAKPAGLPPRAFAEALAAALAEAPEIAQAGTAGPGFVNFHLRDAVWRGQIPAILAAGEAYGDSTLGERRRVDVEYVSANPTGPMHVGHCRGAVVGDALARLLAKGGWDVTREYYINDAGAQVQALGWAAYWRYLEALGTPLTEEEFSALVPGGLQYRGEYLSPVGVALAELNGDALAPGAMPADPALWLDIVRDFTVAAMMTEIRVDLAALGVEHDVFISEAALIAAGTVTRAMTLLAAKGLIYQGVLEPPKGKTPEDWEPREQTLFRATQFGDDVDRPLRKSDGSNTYFANDIANHADKIERGHQELVHVWGADHGGYVKRMAAAVAALSDGAVKLDVVLCQIVRVMKDGEPVRMSKRAGSYITLRDLIEEVGRDAVRFTMLTRKSDAQMDFDLNAVVEQSRENPVFYVQYAHARARSVLRAAGEPEAAELAEAKLELLVEPSELDLIRKLAAWPRTVEQAALAREPHRVAFYLHDLAAAFHLSWNRGRDDSTLRFIREEEPESTRARLALVAATAVVIRSGLAVMGVDPVEEMR
ncbi:arginyl-tRNA synthetase [Humitalea rosea]|uniref:Arginine--tRNA ligase n=1 Tax=Humitalea rosea TaxID=990373 RepID=A0A2W7ISC2_9PROT|nr:arginine--tRNA ligase [Humitalea rosea]PZW49160.1 arginyl-tRNA synthetase [Humitalea rosea]